MCPASARLHGMEDKCESYFLSWGQMNEHEWGPSSFGFWEPKCSYKSWKKYSDIMHFRLKIGIHFVFWKVRNKFEEGKITITSCCLNSKMNSSWILSEQRALRDFHVILEEFNIVFFSLEIYFKQIAKF